MKEDDFQVAYYMLNKMSIEQLEDIIEYSERIKKDKERGSKTIVSEMKKENAKRRLGII